MHNTTPKMSTRQDRVRPYGWLLHAVLGKLSIIECCICTFFGAPPLTTKKLGRAQTATFIRIINQKM